MSILVKTAVATLATAAIAAAGLVIYSWLTGISDADVYAYHKADYRTVDRKLTPGSIVAVSPQGNISEVCSLEADGMSSNRTENAIYYNQLREDFPAYIRSISLVMAVFGGTEQPDELVTQGAANLLSRDTGTFPAFGRSFTGQELEIKDLQVAHAFKQSECEANMAWHLSRGYRVCTVRKSLNAAVLRDDGSIEIRTVAVAFADHSNFVGPRTFAKAGVAYNKAAQSANGKACDGGSLPWIATMRRSLGVIQRIQVPA
jgi:hypothetical protein